MTANVKIRQFIFSFLSVLCCVVMLAACKEAPVLSSDEEEGPPIDVVYSDDWRYITVFFDDPPPITINANVNKNPFKQSRAMTRDTAQFAFDYFEVVFCYTINGTKRVARSSWEIGERAAIAGVYKTDSGIDYSGIEPAEGKGAALLFAGRKIGKTLLGVGRITSVNDVPGAVVTSQSTYVTFDLSAITGSVSFDKDKSSFTTAYHGSKASADNTLVVNAFIRQRKFPLYVLHPGRSEIAAQYRFSFDDKDWSHYGRGIITAPYDESQDIYRVITREVRFPAGSGKYYYPVYSIDQTTKVEMTNNKDAGSPVDDTVTFSFNTTETKNVIAAENGIFTLVFRVPVYAVTEQTGGNAAQRWYLEPGYQSYRYNIDNGRDSTGCGVLIGVNAPSNLELSAVLR